MNPLKNLVLFLLLGLSLSGWSVAYAAQPPVDITLNNIRVIRISVTTTSISFITSDDAIGKLEYTGLDGETVTLTDSVAQADHLFTISELDPSHGYTFVLSATSGKHRSNQYSILLAPESIGEPGQSEIPPVDVIALDGTKISSSLAASTTPYDTGRPSPGIFLITAVGIIGAWVTIRVAKNQQHLSQS